MNTVLFGNGINNLYSTRTWKELIKHLGKTTNVKISNYDKPFPLIYEEIYFKASRIDKEVENKIKIEIASIADTYKTNVIYEELYKLNVANYLTTNYDYAFQKSCGYENVSHDGIIKESLYSLFRRNYIGEKIVWHIHGEKQKPSSICLGYEHYCGQIQQLRNYLVTHTNYKSNAFKNKSLLSRIKENIGVETIYSWVDLFIKSNVHILGLTMNFEEIDLYWLLTKRYRLLNEGKLVTSNKIYYYTPEKYKNEPKIDVLRAIGLEVITINSPHNEEYYKKVFKLIK